ncbi:NUDIX hydrolase [Bifidobacterium aerophilum]|uniref:NUDIX domain-containing protein n=1 Tax=Bifidobacterium aerophilum TaxID=1798155 RepID=A0A6N9Z7K8_9BIFI|nr:NUDIX hydrolase [Bifidobacterium aerophilum]NEG90426.1 NUDIX domain-containing protein [Bifidobacterium aerophilum]
MITPADLARMLDHASVRRTLDPLAPDELMYSTTSRTVKTVEPDGTIEAEAADVTRVSATIKPAQPHGPDTPDTLAADASDAEIQPTIESLPDTVVSSRPSPANMPQRRSSDGPTTFASLDAQELPVVREYSAGGLVFDERGRVAIIARHSRSGHLEWCLPKGHIEKGETPQQTAVREVHEETGILGEVVDSIATIDYWFTGTSQRVHKLVHHFALRQVGGELTVEGDPDHEAEDAIWVDFDDLDGVLSYPNERKIAWLYARKLNRQA